VISWHLSKVGGVHHVRFRVPAPLPGRPRRTLRRSRSTGERSQSMATVRAQEIVAEVEADLVGRKPSCSLGELGREWLAVNDNSVSDAHWKAMERHLRLHFGPLLALDLKDCTTVAVKAALNAYRKDHGDVSALTWRRYLRTLFGWAVASKRLQIIPWTQKDLGVMKAQEIARPVLPVDKWGPWLAAVRAAAGSPEDPRPLIAALLLATGIREMEAVRGRWEWANLDPQRPTYTPGFTKGGKAEVRALPTWLADLLRPLQRPSGWMFPNPDTGQPFARGCCRRIIQAANEAVGTPGITHHRLRATLATLLLAKVSPKDAQAAFEHKDPRTTLIYNMQDPTAVRHALNQIGIQAGLMAG
jgi:integrase